MVGMSLSDYLLSQIKGIVEPPTLPEVRERLRQRTPICVWAPLDTARRISRERRRR